MQVSGVDYTVNTAKAYDKGEAYNDTWYKAASMQRVTVNSVNGKAFDAAATYAVVTSNANFNGMDSSYIFKAAAADNEKSTITTAVVRDVVWMYIKEELGGTIGSQYAAPKGSITLKADAPADESGKDQPGQTVVAGEEYIVQRGDSLWKIAAKVYGRGNLWGKIFESNPQIKNANLIYVGQKLTIPAL
jgi:nucleoid-associated protein YgaU